MNVRYKGAAFVRIPAYSFRQDDGLHVTWYERGIPSTIAGRAQDYENDGWDAYVNHDGPYSTLTATRTQSWSGSYPYITLWSLSTELVEKSLFTLPGAIGEATLFAEGAASYKKQIEDAVSSHTTLDTFTFASHDWAQIIWEEMMRGVQAYEVEYTVLTRTINFDFKEPPGELKLKPTRYIYTKAQLEAIEGVPADVMFTLPDDPGSNPDQAMWGWRIRDQSAEITNATTGQHTTSWVYAAWSTFLYTPFV